MKQLALLVLISVVLSALFGAAITGMPVFDIYTEADPFIVVTALALSLAITSFLFGAFTGDHSWVDRLWSTAPVGFAWIYLVRSDWDFLVLIPVVVITLWGARLTLNFARKGGYSGTEDYRWPVLREKIRNPITWQLFNLLFICMFQIGLMVGFTAPVYLIMSTPFPQSSVGYLVSVLLILVFLIYETVADNQQWAFHQVKRRIRESKEPVTGRFAEDAYRGFLSSGLFRFSRHPNYFGELSIWWCVYFASAAAVGRIINIGLIGPTLLTLLFVGSTRFTETITGSKYPEYETYRRSTSAIIPWFVRSATPRTANARSANAATSRTPTT